MKKGYKNLLMVATVFALIFSNGKIVQATDGQQRKNIIEVSGSGTIKVKPNVAYISANVHTENKDAKKAQEENAKVINAIKKDIISKYKLVEEDIRTSYYSVNPSYDYVDGKQVFRTYVVDHTLEITAKDTGKVGEMADVLVRSGATSISNIRFSILDSDETYNLALQKAIANAASKAKAITGAIGVREGKPIAIIEQSGSTGIIEREMSKMALQDSAMGGVPTSISQSEIEVTAKVSVTFQY